MAKKVNKESKEIVKSYPGVKLVDKEQTTKAVSCYQMADGTVVERQPFNSEAWSGRFVSLPTNSTTTMTLANWGEVIKQMPEGNKLVDVRMISADCLQINGNDVTDYGKVFETSAIGLAPKLIQIFKQADAEKRQTVAVQIDKYEEKGKTRFEVVEL